MMLLLAVLPAAWAACPLQVVAPPDDALALAVGDRDVPRDSLVRADPGVRCAAGVGVRVVSVEPWLRRAGRPAVEAGARACLPAEALAPDPPVALAVPAPPGLSPAPASPPGTAWPALRSTGSCAERGVQPADGPFVPDAALAGAAPTTPARLALQDRLTGALPPLPPGALWVNAWGRANLPMAEEWDAAARAAEQEREGLETPTQREKATVALGPDGAWSHFLGSDPPGSDRWADPAFVVSLARLAVDWRAHCAALPAVDPARCLLQVGDLSYHRDQRPDPLGHRDHRGDCVDLRLFRDDGSRYEAFWNQGDDRPGRGHRYDAALTRAFVAFAQARPETTRLLFADPAAGAELARGHDDHLHLCLEAPAP